MSADLRVRPEGSGLADLVKRMSSVRSRHPAPRIGWSESWVASRSALVQPSIARKGVAMSKFSIRPTLTLEGRTFKGVRGWSGKPLHPPLTDFPIAAYVLAAAFDVISVIGGEDHDWARELWHAGTYAFIGGAAGSVFAALTGLWDAWKASEGGAQ